MSNVSYPSETRLSDSAERELLRNALNQGEPLSVLSMIKSIGRGIANAANAVFNYTVAVADALNEARAHSVRSRGNWHE